MIHVHVAVTPVPQGSIRSFRHRTTGKVVSMSDNRPALHAYREAIGMAFKAAVGTPFPTFPTGAVEIEFVFRLPRPKSHFNSKGVRKASTPSFVTVKPDVDKLIRATLDALTGIAFTDDAQVTIVRAAKLYSETPSTCILIGTATRTLASDR